MQMKNIFQTEMWFKLISVTVLVYMGHAFSEPCETRKVIDNWKRSASNNLTTNTYLCDSLLEEGWYRIPSNAGERMPTECLIGGYRCGTQYPIYLSRKGVTTGEDIFPVTGKIVNRTAYEVLDDRCVNEEYPIRIKNCTLYLVYYLRPTTGCDTAYCFGTELPCPDGQLSQTGFSPGCSNVYPSIRFTSTISVDMHIENVTQESRKYIHETPKFLCRVNDATDDYAYDINFYINNVLITGALYTNVSKTNIETAVLLQKHWEHTFKPNMMVNCSVQARYKDRGVAGPKYFSQIYFAGIKVVDGENGIHVEEDIPISVEIKSTLPIGCSYQKGINVDSAKSGCYVGLYNGVPKYQTTINEVDCSYETFVQSELEFAHQNCRLTIPHVGWNSSYFINVTGVSDHIVNKVDRIVFLRLYTTIDHANKKDILKIWNSIHLPDLKIYISDKDITHINKSCYSSNDPYLRTFDQSKWNINSPNDYGEYIMYKHERLPQQVNVYFSRCSPAGVLCNCGVAVRSADSIFIANFCATGILSNRKINRYITSRICDDQNLIVNKITDKTFKIIFPSGTVVLMKGNDLRTTDSPFTIFSKIDITPSYLDINLTTGLCGRYNNNPTDDFLTRKNSLDSKHDVRQFAKSWRLENNSIETFFDPKGLPPLNYRVQEYCTCTADKSIQGQSSEPNFECKLSRGMKACRQIETSTTVYHASCITSNHRQKRSLEEEDEAPPMYDMMDDEQVEVDDQPAVWRNGLTEKIARQKCVNAFNMLPAFEICTAYVPTVQSVNYIDQCISDMKITGSDIFLYSNIRNFETMCLNDAKKFENLTDKITHSPTGESKNIFTVIAESTCPRNCSGKGYCTEDYKCLDGYMKCRDEQQCIRVDAMCRLDTVRHHCNDGSDMDEEFCKAADCGENARKCDDGAHCVYDSEMCNGFQNCPDGSDEAPQNCTKDRQCQSGLWKCADGIECIDERFVCDNWWYCSDKSDENPELCNQDRQCTTGHSKCADGIQCIPDGMECTGESECIDYSDESPEICHNKLPPVVKDLRAIPYQGKIKVFWMWPDFAGSARGYKIIYGKELSSLRHTQDLGPSRIMHIINNLEPYTSYTVSVVTYNNLGVGQEVTVKATTTGV